MPFYDFSASSCHPRRTALLVLSVLLQPMFVMCSIFVRHYWNRPSISQLTVEMGQRAGILMQCQRRNCHSVIECLGFCRKMNFYSIATADEVYPVRCAPSTIVFCASSLSAPFVQHFSSRSIRSQRSPAMQ